MLLDFVVELYHEQEALDVVVTVVLAAPASIRGLRVLQKAKIFVVDYCHCDLFFDLPSVYDVALSLVAVFQILD